MATAARCEIEHQVASSTGMPRSRKVLLLIDFINPLAFDGAEHIAGAAVEAARAIPRSARSMSAARANSSRHATCYSNIVGSSVPYPVPAGVSGYLGGLISWR